MSSTDFNNNSIMARPKRVKVSDNRPNSQPIEEFISILMSERFQRLNLHAPQKSIASLKQFKSCFTFFSFTLISTIIFKRI